MGGEGGANERLYALSDTFRAFAEGTTDYLSLLDTVAAHMTQLVSDACVIMLAGDDGKWLDPGAVHARDAAATTILRTAVARLPTDSASSGLAVEVVRTGEPILIAEIAPDQLAHLAQPAFAAAVRELSIRSFLCVPLEARGRRLGALSLFRFAAGSPPFSEADQVFARSIGDHAALAISNAQLFESLQRELAERARVEEQAKTLVTLVENSTDVIAMAGLDGKLRFVNAAGRALVGLGAGEIGHLTPEDFFIVDWAKHAEVVRAQGSRQGEGVLRHLVTGELIPMQVSTFLVRDALGQPMCYATVQRDLRETKRLESELRQAQKMEALGRLAGRVAHDFNNLLTVILSYSAMLAKAFAADPAVAGDLDQISRAGHRAADLTRQLLAFSRQQVLEPKPLRLDAVVHEMDGMIRRLIAEDVELRVISGRDLGHVMVDAGQIEQVVLNLVVNACDAMPGGGVLTVETASVVVAAPRAGQLGVPAGAYNVLAVTDTGTGIDEQTQAHLFEPFYTTKGRGKGTGLGLSTVMGIVKQSGGHVVVDSALGRGTTFRVYLPATGDAVATLAAPKRPGQTERGTERIMVVEDDVQVRALVRDVLREAGYDVIEAVDGEHALQLSDQLATPIHLLLTDVIMPKMSGRLLATRFHDKRPGTRVLFMSGYTDDKLGHHGVLDPGVELIQKPLTPSLLLQRVREVLDG